MRVLTGVARHLTGTIRGVNGFDRSPKLAVSDSEGFARFLPSVVSKTAGFSNEMERAVVFPARRRNDLKPLTSRSSGLNGHQACVRKTLNGIRRFLGGRRPRSKGVRKRLTSSSL